jgi:ABC-type transport system involved in cytochrome bd biosynthesis fused ATPase/permease subunit
VVISDEGTIAVDSEMSRLLLGVLFEYAARAAVILISHDPKVLSSCDILYRLHDGLVVEAGRPKDLLLRESAWRSYVMNSQADPRPRLGVPSLSAEFREECPSLQ